MPNTNVELIVQEYGQEAVEDVLWEMASDDMANVVFHLAKRIGLHNVADYAARVISNSGGYSKEDHDAANAYLGG